MHWCAHISGGCPMQRWYQGFPSTAWRASAIWGVIQGHLRHPQGRCSTGLRDTHPAGGIPACPVGILNGTRYPHWSRWPEQPPCRCLPHWTVTWEHSPQNSILYLNIIQESCWDTNHRSKWWVHLSLFPGKTFQLGQLRPSLVAACKLFLLGFQQWAWLPSDISEHFFLIWRILWWSKPHSEGMSSNLFKDITLLFFEMLSACSFLKEGSKKYNVICILLLLIFGHIIYTNSWTYSAFRSFLLAGIIFII